MSAVVMNGHDVASQNNHNKRLKTSLGIVDCKFAPTSLFMKPFMKCLNFEVTPLIYGPLYCVLNSSQVVCGWKWEGGQGLSRDCRPQARSAQRSVLSDQLVITARVQNFHNIIVELRKRFFFPNPL